MLDLLHEDLHFLKVMLVLQFPSAQSQLNYSEGEVGKAGSEVKKVPHSTLMDNLWVAFGVCLCHYPSAL